MESCFPDQQEIIKTQSHVFWIMQFTRNIPEDDEQHFQKIITQRSTHKLHEQFCYTSQDKEGNRKDIHLRSSSWDKKRFK